LLVKDKWQVKLSKCTFAQQQLCYLGHVINAHGIATDPAKVSAVQSWPQPDNVKDLRSFLGLAGYYRKFVKNFAIIAKPLTNLLKKQVLFVWTSVHTEAFTALKHALMSAPVLAVPDFSKTFCIETDASNRGVGAVLQQDGHPLAFISKPLGPRTQGLSTYEKEYLAILTAVEHWRSYLQQAGFIIYTDQKSLVHLNDQRLNTPWQQRMFSKLMGLQYKVVYKQGVQNGAADALSRRTHNSVQLMAISECIPKWISEVASSYEQDEFCKQVIAKLATDPTAVPSYTFVHGLLRYKNRVWIGHKPELHTRIISAMHTSPLGGHSGVPVTVRKLKQYFAWSGMNKAVHKFVTSCSVCKQAKPDRAKYPGLLQPLSHPILQGNRMHLTCAPGSFYTHMIDKTRVIPLQ
jgi:hypothetical protein